MLPLKNMINEAYALDIGRKIKAQARQAMKDGDYIGARAPYGYRKDPDDCHKLLIDENTAPVVKQIFEWAHEHVALNRIVRNLNEMGIPAPSHYKKTTGEITSPGLIGSGKWQTRTVMKILESEVYTGDLVQGKTKIVDHQQVKAGEDNLIIVKCTHEPIISHELFHAVQEYRKQICEESKATPKRPYTPNIFKGKVFCTDCGRSLHRQRAERRKGPDTYWFHCLTNSRVEKDSCKGAMIQEKEQKVAAQDTQSSEVTEDIPEQETVQNRMTSENAAEDSTDQNNSSDTPGRFRFTNETAHTADGAVITPQSQVVQEFANVETVEPLPQSVNTQDVINQIVESARVILTEDKTSMELQLNPQNLGKIILKVTEQEGAVTAKIMTQNAVVKEALEAQTVELRQNLEQAGVKVDAVEVTVASHEFEKNLEQNAEGEKQQGEQQEKEKGRTRRLNLNDLSELSGVMSEEETLAAKMMAEQGNSVDYTA